MFKFVLSLSLSLLGHMAAELWNQNFTNVTGAGPASEGLDAVHFASRGALLLVGVSWRFNCSSEELKNGV